MEGIVRRPDQDRTSCEGKGGELLADLRFRGSMTGPRRHALGVVVAVLARASEAAAQSSDCAIELYRLPLKAYTQVITGRGPLGAQYEVQLSDDRSKDEPAKGTWIRPMAFLDGAEFAIRMPELFKVDQKVKLRVMGRPECESRTFVVQSTTLDA